MRLPSFLVQDCRGGTLRASTPNIMFAAVQNLIREIVALRREALLQRENYSIRRKTLLQMQMLRM